MNGKDLMQALNDIDERYIEEALPWSAAVKKERHPVWALAAGLALCLGLGAGAALLFGGPLLTSGDPGPEVTTLENAATGEARAAEQEAPEVPIPDLEFAVNDTGIGRATDGVYAAGEGTQRELTLDELSSLREQPGLSWMGGYYLTGGALFHETGDLMQVWVIGYSPSAVDESSETFPVTESPAFTLVLGKEGESGLPNAIEDQLFFLEEPNNTVEGVGVRAAQFPYQDSCIDPVSGESSQVDSTLYCTGYTLDGASVGLMAVGGDTLTEEEAQHLAEVAAGYGVHYGLSLEGLSAEPKGKDTPNVNYGDSYHLTVLGPLGSRAPLDFAAYTVETQEEYGSYEEFLQAMEEDFNLGRWPEGFAEGSTNRELTLEEMQSIWGGQLPWQENLPLAGWAVFDPSGDLEGVYLYGADEGSQEIGSRFLVVLRPGPLDWEALRRRELSYDIIQEPNNQVNDQDVYAVTTALDQFYEDDAGERVDLGDHITYQASFQTDSLAVTVYGYAQGAAGDTPTPEEQQAEALARDEAQALVETVVGRSLYGPLSLECIAGGGLPSLSQEESTSSQAESAVSSEIEENESTEGGLNYLDVSFNTSEYIPYMEEQTQLYQHYAEAEQRGETWSVSRGLEEDELNFLLDQDFLPNQEDFAILEGGATLDWMEEPLWVELSGFPTQETRSSGISAFTLYLSKGDVPVSEAKYLSTLFPEPNNTLEGVDIYAFRWEEETSLSQFSTPAEGQPYIPPVYDRDDSVLLALAFQKEDIGVAMTVRCDKWGFASEEEAKDFALSLAENIITQEVIPMENDMQVLSLPEN